MNQFTLIQQDVREEWSRVQDESIQTCVTSPPYWGLRDYNTINQLGQEAHPDLYVQNLVEVFRTVKQKLTQTGTLWLNIGDTYVGTGHKNKDTDPKHAARNGQAVALNNKVAGLKPKDMIGLPWKLAFALQSDGWFLRSDIIWERPNALPSAVKDRPVSSYEHVFLLSKSRQYFYDYEAVKEPTTDGKRMRSQRDVWHINTKPLRSAHVAVFPKELVLPCVLAGSREGDTVLDLFSGSGTTGIVAVENNRNYVGLENNREYYDFSVNRAKSELPEDVQYNV